MSLKLMLVYVILGVQSADDLTEDDEATRPAERQRAGTVPVVTVLKMVIHCCCDFKFPLNFLFAVKLDWYLGLQLRERLCELFCIISSGHQLQVHGLRFLICG